MSAYADSELTVGEVLDRLEEMLYHSDALKDLDHDAKFTWADAGLVHMAVTALMREVLPSPWKVEP